MVKKILLDNNEINFSETDLPILIHGKEHSGAGASLFTVSLMANLYIQGSKMLFLSGYHMARDELLAQVGDENDSIR